MRSSCGAGVGGRWRGWEGGWGCGERWGCFAWPGSHRRQSQTSCTAHDVPRTCRLLPLHQLRCRHVCTVLPCNPAAAGCTWPGSESKHVGNHSCKLCRQPLRTVLPKKRTWLYLARRSERQGAPVLIWPVARPTARSAMKESSVSPELQAHTQRGRGGCDDETCARDPPDSGDQRCMCKQLGSNQGILGLVKAAGTAGGRGGRALRRRSSSSSRRAGDLLASLVQGQDLVNYLINYLID